jgi:hypothetical protein
VGYSWDRAALVSNGDGAPREKNSRAVGMMWTLRGRGGGEVEIRRYRGAICKNVVPM